MKYCNCMFHRIKIILFLIFVFLCTYTLWTYVSQSENTRKATTLTHTLALKTYWHNSFINQDKSASLQELLDLAAKRKQILLEEVQSNPKSFLEHKIPQLIRKQLPQEIIDAHLIEEEKQINGNLVRVIGENFETHTEETSMYIEQDAKNAYRLHFTKPQQNNLPKNPTIAAFGTVLGNELVVDDSLGSQNAQIQNVASEESSISVGNKKIAVLFFNFDNDRSEPVSPSDVEQYIMGNNQSVSNFYKENSFNQLNLSADYFGYYTIPFNNHVDCNNYQWALSADTLAYNQGIDLNNYDFRMYIFPNNSKCTYSAWGSISDNPARTWYNGYVYSYVISHELGHNLELWHANFYNCPENAPLTSCTSTEYGDPTDTMGNSYYHFNAPHKSFVKWLAPEQEQSITQSGTYTVDLIESQTPGVKLLKIPLGTQPGYYYIGYRQNIGFDTLLPAATTQGAQIHFASVYSTATHLLDTTKQTGYPFNDHPLTDGATFSDLENGVTITQLSHNQQSVTLQIHIDDTVCRFRPLATEITPNFQSGNIDETKTYMLNITNQNSFVCPSIPINLDFNYIDTSSWIANFTPQSFDLAPGESKQITITLTPTNPMLTDSIYYFSMYNVGTESNNFSVDFRYQVFHEVSTVYINSSSPVTTLTGPPIQLSALAFSSRGAAIWSNVEYEWGLSSTNTTGTLSTNHNIATFHPLNPGSGDIYVIARSNQNSVMTSYKIDVVEENPGQNRIEISPGIINTTLDVPQINLSALLYNDANEPIWQNVTYNWGISSINSVGTLTASNDVASFFPLRVGQGDLFVHTRYNGKTITKSIPVNVLPGQPTASPSFTYSDVKNLLNNLLTLDDRMYFIPDNKINVFDFASILKHITQLN